MGSGSRNYRALRMKGRWVKKKVNSTVEEKKKVSEEDKKALAELWLKRKKEREEKNK